MSNNHFEELSNNSSPFASMSERQQINYLQSHPELDTKQEERKTKVLDYHQYYLYKKDHPSVTLDKSKLAEREKMKKLSLKEFTHIKKNVYIDRKRYMFIDDDTFRCICAPKTFTESEAAKIISSGYQGKTEDELFGCGSNCVNKLIGWECNDCPCGVSCKNRRFQLHEYADVYPIQTKDRGFGLCAGTFLPKGSFIIQYIGEIYTLTSEYGQKKLAEYKDRTCTYLMSLGKGEVIDPTTRGNFARLINHSCDPNCETQKWHVQGEISIGIFTKRDIQMDEELTFDYGFDIMRTTFQRCLCGAPNCKGYLGIAPTGSPNASLSHHLICDACKEHCKTKEGFVVCETCKRIYHKKCSVIKGQNRIKQKNYSYFTCNHCLKKEDDKKNSQQTLKIEEEKILEENYEVSAEEIVKIKKNLHTLISCGATLFWDYQQQNAIYGTSNKLDIKIKGTQNQIQKVKEMIKQIINSTSLEDDKFTLNIQVPKVFVRKIIGHQNRNLNAYKLKFNVEIEYDMNLITDEIFPLQESTSIQLKGKESNVRAVENDIKGYLFNLKVLTIYLMPNDYHLVRNSICQIKTEIDPADVRLRKRDGKIDKDLKHPFYYISNNTKDLVIIGFEREVEKGEKIINSFILRQNTLNFNYSLSFLFPIYLRKQLNNFLEAKKDIIKDKKIFIDYTEPEYLRRHLSVYIEGKWKDIVDIKNLIWKDIQYINSPESIILNPSIKRHNIDEFEQYAFNQEHKLISKIIKNYILEQNTQFKNWDYISADIKNIPIKSNFDVSSINSDIKNKINSNNINLIEGFINTCDKDTKLNYLLNLNPGDYKNIFKMNQNELIQNMIDLFTEVYDSYKDNKSSVSLSLNSESKLENNIYQSNYENISSPSIKSEQNSKDDSVKHYTLNVPNFSKSQNDNFNVKFEHNFPITNPLNSFNQIINQKSIFSPSVNNIEHQPLISQQKMEPEIQKIYNFSNINQMNISININDNKNYNNDSNKNTVNTPSVNFISPKKEDNNYLQRKIRRSSSRHSSSSDICQNSNDKQYSHYHSNSSNYIVDSKKEKPMFSKYTSRYSQDWNNRNKPYKNKSSDSQHSKSNERPKSKYYSKQPSYYQSYKFNNYSYSSQIGSNMMPINPIYQNNDNYYVSMDPSYRKYTPSYKSFYQNNYYEPRKKNYYNKDSDLNYKVRYHNRDLSRSSSKSRSKSTDKRYKDNY